LKLLAHLFSRLDVERDPVKNWRKSGIIGDDEILDRDLQWEFSDVRLKSNEATEAKKKLTRVSPEFDGQ